MTVNLTVGPLPPDVPGTSDLWWNSEIGTLFIYYDDGNTRQWVVTNPSGSTPGPKGDTGGVGPPGPIGQIIAGPGLVGGGATSSVTISLDPATTMRAAALIADVMNYTDSNRPAVVFTTGRLVPGDGGGGPFYWDPNSAQAHDGVMVLKPYSQGDFGRYIRLHTGTIYAVWFCGFTPAVGKGDNLAALQAALNAAAGGVCEMPPDTGPWPVSRTLKVPPHTEFKLNGVLINDDTPSAVGASQQVVLLNGDGAEMHGGTVFSGTQPNTFPQVCAANGNGWKLRNMVLSGSVFNPMYPNVYHAVNNPKGYTGPQFCFLAAAPSTGVMLQDGVMEDVMLKYCLNAGSFYGGRRYSVRNVWTWYNGRAGMNLGAGMPMLDCFFQDCLAVGSGNYGWQTANANSNRDVRAGDAPPVWGVPYNNMWYDGLNTMYCGFGTFYTGTQGSIGEGKAGSAISTTEQVTGYLRSINLYNQKGGSEFKMTKTYANAVTPNLPHGENFMRGDLEIRMNMDVGVGFFQSNGDPAEDPRTVGRSDIKVNCYMEQASPHKIGFNFDVYQICNSMGFHWCNLGDGTGLAGVASPASAFTSRAPLTALAATGQPVLQFGSVTGLPGLVLGAYVSSTATSNIPVGAKVLSINSGTNQVTLTANLLGNVASGAQICFSTLGLQTQQPVPPISVANLTASTVDAHSPSIVLNSLTDGAGRTLIAGMILYGLCFDTGYAYVSRVDTGTNTVTLNKLTTSGSLAPMTFNASIGSLTVRSSPALAGDAYLSFPAGSVANVEPDMFVFTFPNSGGYSSFPDGSQVDHVDRVSVPNRVYLKNAGVPVTALNAAQLGQDVHFATRVFDGGLYWYCHLPDTSLTPALSTGVSFQATDIMVTGHIIGMGDGLVINAIAGSAVPALSRNILAHDMRIKSCASGIRLSGGGQFQNIILQDNIVDSDSAWPSSNVALFIADPGSTGDLRVHGGRYTATNPTGGNQALLTNGGKMTVVLEGDVVFEANGSRAVQLNSAGQINGIVKAATLAMSTSVLPNVSSPCLLNGGGTWDFRDGARITVPNKVAWGRKAWEQTSGPVTAAVNTSQPSGPFQLTTTLASSAGTAVLNFADTTGVAIGNLVGGVGTIQSETVVTGVTPTTVTVNKNFTGGGVGITTKITFWAVTKTTNAVSPTLTQTLFFADTTNILPGMNPVAVNISPALYVTAVTPTSVTLSGNITGTGIASGAIVGFYFLSTLPFAATTSNAIGTGSWLSATGAPTLTPVTNAATATGNVLSFASVAGIVVGQEVGHANLAQPTYVQGISGTNVTVSRNVFGAGVLNGDTITFSDVVTSVAASYVVLLQNLSSYMPAGTAVNFSNQMEVTGIVQVSSDLKGAPISGTTAGSPGEKVHLPRPTLTEYAYMCVDLNNTWKKMALT